MFLTYLRVTTFPFPSTSPSISPTKATNHNHLFQSLPRSTTRIHQAPLAPTHFTTRLLISFTPHSYRRYIPHHTHLFTSNRTQTSFFDMNSAVDRTQIGKGLNKSKIKHTSFNTSKDVQPTAQRKTKAELAPVRRSLPIFEYRDALIHAIATHANIVVVAETGSGKTTQVPQYLYEAGLVSKHPEDIGCIAITQPRRVAAMTLAERVSQEVGTELGDVVGYTIRFDDKSSKNTKLKFLTDGMLLREIQIDPKLSKYKVIVLDEAHERTLNTDILFGLLKLLQNEHRRDLKLVVMSATLDADKFSKYLSDAPVALIPGRTHPVDVFYVDKDATEAEMGEKTVNFYDKNDLVALTVMQLHQDKPMDGDILVFMPGSDEIEACKEVLQDRSKLLQELWKAENEDKLQKKRFLAFIEYRQKKRREKRRENKKMGKLCVNNDNDDDNDNDLNGEDVEVTFANFSLFFDQLTMDEREDISLSIDLSDISVLPPPEIHVVSLYSTLDPKAQLLAFEPAPEGKRKVILSTNIAETSVTVSGVKYVVDTGLSKVKTFEYGVGATGSLQSEPISRAEASQRTGRAGREQPGECYRLYTEEEYEEAFKPTPIPEIARSSFTSSFLQLLSLNISNPATFPLIDSPPREAFITAGRELLMFNAMDHTGLSELGRLMATFPIEPIFARLLILSARPELLYLTKMPIFDQAEDDGLRESGKQPKHNNKGKTQFQSDSENQLTNKRRQISQLKHSREVLQKFTLEAIKAKLDREDIDPSILATPCSEEMCLLIAALSVDNLTIPIPQNSQNNVLRAKVENFQLEHYSPYGDVFFYFTILVNFIKCGTVEKRQEFCRRYYYNFRNLAQAMNIYQQLCCLVLQAGLPLISCLKDSHPKKTLTYAQFYNQRNNQDMNIQMVNEVMKQAILGGGNKDEINAYDNVGQHYEPPLWLRIYLDENQDQKHAFLLSQLDKEDEYAERYNHGNKDQQDKDEGNEWEENLAKTLTAAFFQNLAVMNDDGKYSLPAHSGTRSDKLQLHPTSTLNHYFRVEKRNYKELQAQVQSRVQNNQSLPRELRTSNTNPGKGGIDKVPQTFKQFSQYQYILYSELLRTKQSYLRGCFKTKAEWLEIYSRGHHSIDTSHLALQNQKQASTALTHGQTHDINNTQQNTSWMGTKAAFSNLTGKTLSHNVGLGAGQKELGLQKSKIGADGKIVQDTKANTAAFTDNNNSSKKSPSSSSSQQPAQPQIKAHPPADALKRQAKLAVGVGGGAKKRPNNILSETNNASSQQHVALGLGELLTSAVKFLPPKHKR